MRKEDFLDLINDIDDDLIAEAEKTNKVAQNHSEENKKRIYFQKIQNWYGKVAACIAVVLVGGLVVWNFADEEKSTKTPETQFVAEVSESGTVKSTLFGGNLADIYQNGIYNGIGSGRFVYNNKTYCVVDSNDYLLENSLPTQIEFSDLGRNLANNIQDTANNTIGNIFELNNVDSDDVLVLQNFDGALNIAIEEE